MCPRKGNNAQAAQRTSCCRCCSAAPPGGARHQTRQRQGRRATVWAPSPFSCTAQGHAGVLLERPQRMTPVNADPVPLRVVPTADANWAANSSTWAPPFSVVASRLQHSYPARTGDACTPCNAAALAAASQGSHDGRNCAPRVKPNASSSLFAGASAPWPSLYGDGGQEGRCLAGDSSKVRAERVPAPAGTLHGSGFVSRWDSLRLVRLCFLRPASLGKGGATHTSALRLTLPACRRPARRNPGP